MSVAESAASSYADAVASAVPFHRAALLVFLALFIAAYRISTEASTLSYLSSIPLEEFTSISSLFLRRMVLGDVFLAAVAVAISSIGARFATWALFSLALRSTSLADRINSAPLVSSDMTVAERREAVDLVESSLEKPAKRIRALNRSAEFLGGCGILTLALGLCRSGLDVAVGLGLVVSSIAILNSREKTATAFRLPPTVSVDAA